MKQCYRVAGHVFSFETDNDDLWKKMDNYSPFETDARESLLFSLKVVPSIPDGERSLFLSASPQQDDEPKIDIYRQADGWLFDMFPVAVSKQSYRLWTSHDFTEGQLQAWDSRQCGRFPADNAMMLMFALCSATLDTLELHSSVTVKDGRAYLFLGRSGAGKSTHSRMWLENLPGCHLMNDDNPALRVMPDGQIMIFGTPWSGKTPCYRNEQAPAGAFVSIRQCKENRIARLPVLDSYAALFSSCSGFRQVQSIADGMAATFEKVLQNVPFYVLDCLPDADAARLCSSTVER